MIHATARLTVKDDTHGDVDLIVSGDVELGQPERDPPVAPEDNDAVDVRSVWLVLPSGAVDVLSVERWRPWTTAIEDALIDAVRELPT